MPEPRDITNQMLSKAMEYVKEIYETEEHNQMPFYQWVARKKNNINLIKSREINGYKNQLDNLETKYHEACTKEEAGDSLVKNDYEARRLYPDRKIDEIPYSSDYYKKRMGDVATNRNSLIDTERKPQLIALYTIAKQKVKQQGGFFKNLFGGTIGQYFKNKSAFSTLKDELNKDYGISSNQIAHLDKIIDTINTDNYSVNTIKSISSNGKLEKYTQEELNQINLDKQKELEKQDQKEYEQMMIDSQKEANKAYEKNTQFLNNIESLRNSLKEDTTSKDQKNFSRTSDNNNQLEKAMDGPKQG